MNNDVTTKAVARGYARRVGTRRIDMCKQWFTQWTAKFFGRGHVAATP